MTFSTGGEGGDLNSVAIASWLKFRPEQTSECLGIATTGIDLKFL
jgi:hypothetical protein